MTSGFSILALACGDAVVPEAAGDLLAMPGTGEAPGTAGTGLRKGLPGAIEVAPGLTEEGELQTAHAPSYAAIRCPAKSQVTQTSQKPVRSTACFTWSVNMQMVSASSTIQVLMGQKPPFCDIMRNPNKDEQTINAVSCLRRTLESVLAWQLVM